MIDNVQLPAPKSKPTPPQEAALTHKGQQTMAEDQSDMPQQMSDGERVAKRIAAKQFFLRSIGIDWEPDDDDVERERQQLPEDGSIVRLPVFEPKRQEEAKAAEAKPASFDFTPEDAVEDDLDEEEWNLIKEHRKSKQQGSSLPPKPPMADVRTPGTVVVPQEVYGAP